MSAQSSAPSPSGSSSSSSSSSGSPASSVAGNNSMSNITDIVDMTDDHDDDDDDSILDDTVATNNDDDDDDDDEDSENDNTPLSPIPRTSSFDSTTSASPAPSSPVANKTETKLKAEAAKPDDTSTSASTSTSSAAPVQHPTLKQLMRDPLTSFPDTWEVVQKKGGKYKITAADGTNCKTLREGYFYLVNGVLPEREAKKIKVGGEVRGEVGEDDVEIVEIFDDSVDAGVDTEADTSVVDMSVDTSTNAETTTTEANTSTNESMSPPPPKKPRIKAASKKPPLHPSTSSSSSSSTFENNDNSPQHALPLPLPSTFYSTLFTPSTSLYLYKSSLIHRAPTNQPTTLATNEYQGIDKVFKEFCKIPYVEQFSSPFIQLNPSLGEAYDTVNLVQMSMDVICRKAIGRKYKSKDEVKLDVYRMLYNNVKFNKSTNTSTSTSTNKKVSTSTASCAVLSEHLRVYFNELMSEYLLPSIYKGYESNPELLEFKRRGVWRINREALVSDVTISLVSATKLAKLVKVLIDNKKGAVDALDLNSPVLRDATINLLTDAYSKFVGYSTSSERIKFDEAFKILRSCSSSQNEIEPYIEKIIATSTLNVSEFVLRGNDVSCIWGTIMRVVWARENSKKPYWPAIVVSGIAPTDKTLGNGSEGISYKELVIGENNENKFRGKIKEDLIKSRKSAKNLSEKFGGDYWLVEFMGMHEFAWCKSSDVLENFERELDPNFDENANEDASAKRKQVALGMLPSSSNVEKWDAALAEANWAKNELAYRVDDVCGDALLSDDEGEDGDDDDDTDDKEEEEEKESNYWLWGSKKKVTEKKEKKVYGEAELAEGKHDGDSDDNEKEVDEEDPEVDLYSGLDEEAEELLASGGNPTLFTDAGIEFMDHIYIKSGSGSTYYVGSGKKEKAPAKAKGRGAKGKANVVTEKKEKKEKKVKVVKAASKNSASQETKDAADGSPSAETRSESLATSSPSPAPSSTSNYTGVYGIQIPNKKERALHKINTYLNLTPSAPHHPTTTNVAAPINYNKYDGVRAVGFVSDSSVIPDGSGIVGLSLIFKGAVGKMKCNVVENDGDGKNEVLNEKVHEGIHRRMELKAKSDERVKLLEEEEKVLRREIEILERWNHGRLGTANGGVKRDRDESFEDDGEEEDDE